MPLFPSIFDSLLSAHLCFVSLICLCGCQFWSQLLAFVLSLGLGMLNFWKEVAAFLSFSSRSMLHPNLPCSRPKRQIPALVGSVACCLPVTAAKGWLQLSAEDRRKGWSVDPISLTFLCVSGSAVVVFFSLLSELLLSECEYSLVWLLLSLVSGNYSVLSHFRAGGVVFHCA